MTCLGAKEALIMAIFLGVVISMTWSALNLHREVC
jgi:hypothetical protein